MRHLDVYHNGEPVGALQEDNNIWAFAYAEAWIGNSAGFDLSPALPRGQGTIRDGSSIRPVQWYFDNLLPEEALRQVVAREAGLPSEDAFGLLAYYGAESAGALVLLQPGADARLPDGRIKITPGQLSQRIRELPRTSLQKAAPKRMSLAGAQHKMLVIVDGNDIYEPEAGTPSTHILKPNHPDDGYPASVMNEYFTMRLARLLGIHVPDVQIRYVPEPVYIVERFDRIRDDAGAVQRLHVIDTCQLLNKDRTFKYTGATIDSLRDAVARCRSRIEARLGLFRWAVFNVLTGNGDNHLKNISFIVDHEGIRIAPAYDLLATAVYDTASVADHHARWPQTELALKVSDTHSTFGALTRADLLALGCNLGLNERTVRRELEQQTGRILDAADRLMDDVRAEHEQQVDASPDPVAARKHWGVEEKVLLAIRHIVIRDMQERLRRHSIVNRS